MRSFLLRGLRSFCISAFAGTIVNLMIDCFVNACGNKGFISMSPYFVSLFPTPAIAAYVNVFLYGVIGFTFATMTFIFSIEKMSMLSQSIIYFVITSAVCLAITMILWQLQKYPIGFICSLAGYAFTHVIMFVQNYRKVKKDISEINALMR